MQLKDDAIVWTCAPAIENGYDTRLVRPHQVKLLCDINGCWYGYAFDENGQIDDDSNATVFANENNCFETEKEAVEHYGDYLSKEIASLQEELVSVRAIAYELRYSGGISGLST
jgi:hypothetical protein